MLTTNLVITDGEYVPHIVVRCRGEAYLRHKHHTSVLADLGDGPFTKHISWLTGDLGDTVLVADEQKYLTARSAIKPYTPNGDMIAKAGQIFRCVGWQINGGPRDKEILAGKLFDFNADFPIGSLTPVYVEVGD